jgi:ABC-type spermidine/putrescine transport system permease subunit I
LLFTPYRHLRCGDFPRWYRRQAGWPMGKAMTILLIVVGAICLLAIATYMFERKNS